MEAASSKGTINGEKGFWRTRLITIIGLSLVLLMCSYGVSGEIYLRAQHVDNILKQDNSTVIYTNNPQIAIEMNKVKLFLYIDIALKSLLLVIGISLILLVYYALKTKPHHEEREGLLNTKSSSINGADASVSLPNVTNQVIKEGVIYEPYSDATLTAIVNDDSIPAFNRVSSALYKLGPKAAHRLLFMLESKLAPEETQYLVKTLGEKNVIIM